MFGTVQAQTFRVCPHTPLPAVHGSVEFRLLHEDSLASVSGPLEIFTNGQYSSLVNLRVTHHLT